MQKPICFIFLFLLAFKINAAFIVKIYHSTDNITPALKTVVSTGTFDGLHRGHKAIIDKMKQCARDIGGETVIITFDPHPRVALGADADKLRLLTDTSDKINLLRDMGIDKLLVIPFTPAFAAMSYRDFVQIYLVEKLRSAVVVIGYNHHFGKQREGNHASLIGLADAYGFSVEQVGPVDMEGMTVSSTRIRTLLNEGELVRANRMLGYCYTLRGTVNRGAGRGRLLGFPTANIRIADPYKQIPARGAYAVRAHLDGKIYDGMCNIGIKPTFDESAETVEVHLFNFKGDIYAQNLGINFIARLRGEIKFSGPETLSAQLLNDRANALRLLGTCNCKELLR